MSNLVLGNVFCEHCPRCGHRRILDHPTPLIGQKPTGNVCNKLNNRGSTCRGNMIDAVLDWEHDLPEPFYSDSISKCKKADLSIVLGSSLQIQPGKFHYIDQVRFFLTFFLTQQFFTDCHRARFLNDNLKTWLVRPQLGLRK